MSGFETINMMDLNSNSTSSFYSQVYHGDRSEPEEKAPKRFAWNNQMLNELVNVICDNEEYRRKIIKLQFVRESC